MSRSIAELLAARSRGELKRNGGWLDQHPELKPDVLAEGRRRGVELPDEAVRWPGKKLLRLARGREEASRVRTNPIARDEAFRCAFCGHAVRPHGRTARDHCPRCLRSLHVDEVPGDRASDCGGILHPTGVETKGSKTVIVYTCEVCGQTKRNQALLDGDEPDATEVIAEVSAHRGTAPAISKLRFRVGEAATRLWTPGERVAIGVSGGLDSTALLDLLAMTSGWHKGQLQVVTVDHGVREDSADDAAAVEALAARLGLPCTRVTVQSAPDEQALRTARYGVFASLDVDVVALAHHADDQVETLLLQLLRGAGTKGRGAMLPSRDHGDKRIVRPLLGVSRDELLAWATWRELSWREDPSNADPRYLRNRVRAELVPLLEQLRPGASDTLLRAAHLAALDEDFFTRRPHPAPPWSVAELRDAHPAESRRWLRAALPEASATHIDAVLDGIVRGSGRVQLPGGRVVRIGADAVVVENDN